MAEDKNNSNLCGEGEVPDKEGHCVMPEVTFSTFVMSLNTSVLYHLGELPDPESGETFVNLDLVRPQELFRESPPYAFVERPQDLCRELPPLAFLADPSRWLRVMSEHRATLSAAPNFAFELSC